MWYQVFGLCVHFCWSSSAVASRYPHTYGVGHLGFLKRAIGKKKTKTKNLNAKNRLPNCGRVLGRESVCVVVSVSLGRLVPAAFNLSSSSSFIPCRSIPTHKAKQSKKLTAMEVVDEYEDDSSSSPSITAVPTTDPVELERQRMLQTVQRTTTQILSGANNSNNNTTNTSNHPSHGSPDGGGPATRGIARKASLQRGGGGGGGEEMVKTVGGGRGPPGRTNSSLLRSGGGGGGATTGMMAVRTLAAPTRDTDCLSSMRGNSVQRANSSLRLQRSISSRAAPAGRGLVAAVPRTHSMQVGGGGLVPPRRAPPSRTCSVDSTNSLRAYRRDQLANVRIESSRGVVVVVVLV